MKTVISIVGQLSDIQRLVSESIEKGYVVVYVNRTYVEKYDSNFTFILTLNPESFQLTK